MRLSVELMVDSPQLFPSVALMLRAMAIASQARIGGRTWQNPPAVVN